MQNACHIQGTGTASPLKQENTVPVEHNVHIHNALSSSHGSLPLACYIKLEKFARRKVKN